MNYTQAYNYLISLNNLPRNEYMKDPRHCSWYLKRLQFFLNIIGNPEKKVPHYIHVTGTSGKGSVCLLLDSILRANGQKVGVLTSPHPSVITERWDINGKPMSQKQFSQNISQLKSKLDQYVRKTPYDMLSYGEFSTAMALYHFAKQKVDWAVLEVGCGGRYDSTNIIPHKDTAVITNIGLDHKGIIGNTKTKIAYEKSGIIKKGCKVFTMEKNKKIIEVIKKENKKNKTEFNIIKNTSKILQQDLDGIKFNHAGENYFLPILGKHQIDNAVLAIEIALSLKIPVNNIKQGLKKVKIPVCMEIVSKKPLIILDGGHNPEKIKTTVATAKFINKPIHLIVGFSYNKQWLNMIKQLSELDPLSIACTRFTENYFRKATNPKDIADEFKKYLPKIKTEVFLDPKDALAWSKKQIETNDLILTTGSVFLGGELRKLFKNTLC
ncbi:MAG: Mur ligase family protein [bacterium]